MDEEQAFFIKPPLLEGQMKNMRTAGYTMLEILSSVSIILVLVSLLFSAITATREKGQQVECINNQKNLAAALIMYAHDNEAFPTAIAMNGMKGPYTNEAVGESGNAYAGVGVESYYNQQMEITHCPKVNGTITDPVPVYSYGINTVIKGRNLNDVINPSQTILLTDSANKDEVTGKVDVSPRHMGGAIAGFADGHVQWVQYSEIVDVEEGTGTDGIQTEGDSDLFAPPDESGTTDGTTNPDNPPPDDGSGSTDGGTSTDTPPPDDGTTTGGGTTEIDASSDPSVDDTLGGGTTDDGSGSTTNGNNGVGNGEDPQPPGDPPINDGPGTGPGNPGNKGGVKVKEDKGK